MAPSTRRRTRAAAEASRASEAAQPPSDASDSEAASPAPQPPKIRSSATASSARRGRAKATIHSPRTSTKSNTAAEDTQLMQSVPTHSHGTRKQNQTRHPAKDPGLNWQTEKATRDAAEIAKTEARIVKDTKKAEKAAHKRRETEAFLKLAAIEDSRARHDQEELEYMERTTRIGYVGSGIQVDADDGAADGDAPMEIESQQFGADDEDLSGMDLCSAYQPSNSEHSGDEDNVEAEEEEQCGSDDEITGQPSTKVKAKVKRRHDILDTISAQRNRVDLSADESGPESYVPRKRGANTEPPDMSSSAARVKKKKDSPVDSSAFDEDWLAAHTEAPSALPSRTPRSRSQTSSRVGLLRPGRVNASPAKAATQAATPGWQTRLQAQLSTPFSSPSLSQSATPTRALGTSSSARLSRTVTRPEEEVRGLNDGDVAVSRSAVVGRMSDGIGSREQPFDIFSDHENTPTPAAAKVKRRSRNQVAAEDSLSANNLPPSVRPYWDNICASLCDYYGARENPWVLDIIDAQKINRQRQSGKGKDEQPAKGKNGRSGKGKDGPSRKGKDLAAPAAEISNEEEEEEPEDPDFTELLKFIVNTVCPEEQFDVKSDSKICRIARQAVYNWRRTFFNRAKTVVYKAHEERFPIPKKGVRNNNTAAIAAWAKLANSYGSEAFWEHPDTNPNGNPTGALLSTYVLDTFSTHLERREGSIFADAALPCGALALACTAIDVTFQGWYTGTFQQPAEFKRIDYDTLGGLTKKWLRDSVQPGYVDKPHRFHKYIARAEERLSKTPSGAPLSGRVTPPPVYRAVVDPDSSSPRP